MTFFRVQPKICWRIFHKCVLFTGCFTLTFRPVPPKPAPWFMISVLSGLGQFTVYIYTIWDFYQSWTAEISIKLGCCLSCALQVPFNFLCSTADDWYSSSLESLLYTAYTVCSCVLLLWHQFLSIRSLKFLIFTFLSVFKHNFKVLVYRGIFSFGWLSLTLLFAYRCIYRSLSKRKLTIRNK